MINERLITPLSGKMDPALRDIPDKTPLGVARTQSTHYAHGAGSCLFGLTKPRALRLDWHFIRDNSNHSNRVNRP
jgi:hypothetical protein